MTVFWLDLLPIRNFGACLDVFGIVSLIDLMSGHLDFIVSDELNVTGQ